MTSYYNQEEYQEALKIENSQKQAEIIKNLADKGNVQAVGLYGSYLMFGCWNVSQIEIDFASGKLLPEPANPRQDPYLLIQRDQYKAIEYLKKAACFETVHCAEILQASAIIAYCRRKKPDIGHTPSRLLDDFFIGLQFDFLAMKASPVEVNANPLMAMPFVRPVAQPPGTKLFVNFSMELRKFIFYEIVIAEIHFIAFAVFINAVNEKIPASSFLLALFIGFLHACPFLIELIMCNAYSSVPLCSCAEMKKAFEMRLGRLPAECRNGYSPFETTSMFVRNVHHIKQNTYVFFLIIPIALTVFKFVKIDFIERIFDTSSISYWASVLGSLTLSLGILSVNKTLTWKDRVCLNQLALETELSTKQTV